MVNVLILLSTGTNCNNETAEAFKTAGANVEQKHISEIDDLMKYDILALPGGFSYGDYISSGAILANELNHTIKKDLEAFIAAGKKVVGICNGFQVLIKMGLFGEGMTITYNDSGKFECRWVRLKGGNSELTKGVTMDMPVAHGEGKFVATKEALTQLEDNKQVLFYYSQSTYPHNPNGSMKDIAGITNKTGNVIGLMPHPERNARPLDGHDGSAIAFFRKITGDMK